MKHKQVSFDLNDTSHTGMEESNPPPLVEFLQKHKHKSSRQANLPGKQQPHDGEEYGENKEDIRGAHHCVVGEFIGLSSDLVDVEPDGEDESSHAEQNHSCEGDPSGVSRGFSAPVGHHQQSAGDGEGDDAQDDEEERGDPLWRKLGGEAGPLSAVDRLALTDETYCQSAGCSSSADPVRVGDAGDGEDVCSEEEAS